MAKIFYMEKKSVLFSGIYKNHLAINMELKFRFC